MNTQVPICALATPSGGAIAIIRISGTGCITIANRIFRPAKGKPLTDTPPRSVRFGYLINQDGSTLDECMAITFRAPHSYTGEDSVELSLHGSSYILGETLRLLCANGCRQALPGEFTQQAFLNGKMDLSQAEAVADLIAASNKATHKIALSQLRGDFSSELSLLREQLLKLTSLLELELDFSDHEDLEFADRTELQQLAQTIDNRIVRLAHSFETGQALKHGIPVAIVGKTNVGKSTLLNRLLKDDRAIVSDVHGTTRDTIEDTMLLNGITFRIIDTAGIRQTDDTVERIGIDRTYQAIEKAKIILWVIDENPTTAEIDDIRHRAEGKALITIWNKADIHPHPLDTRLDAISISAKNSENIETLEQAIYSAANIPEYNENDVIVTSARHYEALSHAHHNLLRVLDGLHSSLSGDLLAEDLRLVLSDLSDITGGAITPQEALNNIFSHFCVGK